MVFDEVSWNPGSPLLQAKLDGQAVPVQILETSVEVGSGNWQCQQAALGRQCLTGSVNGQRLTGSV